MIGGHLVEYIKKNNYEVIEFDIIGMEKNLI